MLDQNPPEPESGALSITTLFGFMGVLTLIGLVTLLIPLALVVGIRPGDFLSGGEREVR